MEREIERVGRQGKGKETGKVIGKKKCKGQGKGNRNRKWRGKGNMK